MCHQRASRGLWVENSWKFRFYLWQCTLQVTLNISRSHVWGWEHFSTCTFHFWRREDMPYPWHIFPISTQDYQHLKGIDLDWNIWTNLMVGSVNIARFRHEFFHGLKFKRASSCSSCKASETTQQDSTKAGCLEVDMTCVVQKIAADGLIRRIKIW